MFLDTIRSHWCGRTFLSAASFLLASCAPSFSADQQVNPTARLKITRTTAVWNSPDGKVSAHKARFSPDGKTLAWVTSDGRLLAADVESGKTRPLWQSDGGSVTEPVWSSTGDLAACVAIREGGKTSRTAILSTKGTGAAKAIMGTDGAETVAWRPDAKALAFSTQSALFHLDLPAAKPLKLADERKGWRPKGAPAYEDLTFVGTDVAARAAGTQYWVLASCTAQVREIGDSRAIVPTPDGKGLFFVFWEPGPAKIPRGAGIVRFAAPDKEPELIVEGFSRKVVIGKQSVVVGRPRTDLDDLRTIYWLVDISDSEYPTTLRVSADGKTLMFIGVKIGPLSKNPWRELCLWRGSAEEHNQPEALAELGPPFKRIDVGRQYAIGWRIIIDPACILVDFTRGKAWRLPKEFEVQRTNTDVLTDKLLVGAARGSEVVLIQLEEEKAP